MKLIRAMFLLLAVCLPTSWTLAHAEEGAAGAAGGEMKDAKPAKKKGKKKKEGGDMGDMKKDDADKK
jgi:hypothetical protein